MHGTWTLRALVGLAALWAIPALAQAPSPSFPCRKAATKSEIAICANEVLARLDRDIATAYRQLRRELRGQLVEGAENPLAQEQTAFLAERDACMADESCLARTMITRRAELALERTEKDPREIFVGRYSNRYGWIIVRRTYAGAYEVTGATADPAGARWTCDLSATIDGFENGVGRADAGEENDTRPLRLTMRGATLRIMEDPERRLAGYTCGANGFVEGDYKRVPRLP
jgi:uncharacterized protein